MGLTESNCSLFGAPGFIVSPVGKGEKKENKGKGQEGKGIEKERKEGRRNKEDCRKDKKKGF